MLYLCDHLALLIAVKRWIGEGVRGSARRKHFMGSNQRAPEKEQQRRFWSKCKRIEENLRMKKPTSKQTRLFQAKTLPWNGTAGHIEQSSPGKSLAGKEVK